MNGLGKPFRKKNPILKIEKKTVKIKMKLAHVNKKLTSEKANLCSNTVFSLFFKIRVKKSMPQNPSLFRSTSCFGVTKITTPI